MSRGLTLLVTLTLGISCFAFLEPASSEKAAAHRDWPTWRHDSQRTACSKQELSTQLHLQWARDYPPQKTAWLDQPHLVFDRIPEPVVLGTTLFFGSARNDALTALDTRTGAEKWTFPCDGPIRFAPVAWEDRVYFVSDDGYLYCLEASTGKLLWKFRGGPSDRRILGNGRLISTWPARGAPVVADGTVYFAAGIWPFMGIFLHALDARTGKVVWTTDGDGSSYVKQPHNSDSFAGVAPQGPLVVQGNRLLIPGGRSVPACYDRATGKLLHFRLAENNKLGGGSDVAVLDDLVFNGGIFDLPTGLHLGPLGKLAPIGSFKSALDGFKIGANSIPVGKLPVLAEDLVVGISGGKYQAFDPKQCKVEIAESKDSKGKITQRAKFALAPVSSFDAPAGLQALIRSGSRLYAGSPGKIEAIDLPLPTEKGEKPVTSWQTKVTGTPASLISADERLFAVTLEGQILCFGPEKVEPRTWQLEARQEPRPPEAWVNRARTILETTKVRDGYCLVWGLGTGQLLLELARQSNLTFIAVDPDKESVQRVRRQLTAAGLYGERITVHVADPVAFPFPPYLANLIVSEDLKAARFDAGAAFTRKLFQTLRPYGGAACLEVSPPERPAFARLVGDLALYGAKLKESSTQITLSREGALPGAGNWTHEHADAANTRVSKDQLVKVPLGLLWFGGSSNEGILPRHGHGPQPQVIDGRIIVEGLDVMRAMDVYTGRVLWESSVPGVGKVYNNAAHQPGANATGSNYVSTSDSVYVVNGKSCLRLDVATGKKIGEFQLPKQARAKAPPTWGYLNVCEDFLVGGADPLVVTAPPGGVGGPPPTTSEEPAKTPEPEKDDKPQTTPAKETPKKPPNESLSSSKHLVVMDRQTGRVLWTLDAHNNFRHNAICMGGGRLYCVDLPSATELARLKRRGEEPRHKARLLALDLRTGTEIWSSDADVFGTWLSYSAKHDVLMEAGRQARDTLWDEPKGMRAYKGSDGKPLWYEKSYVGPAMIHGDAILKDQSACDLLTGKPKMREDPITGKLAPWTWTRNYGCNTPLASEHLMTFRSGAAGFCDLANDGGTGNFGGFRSSCTNNLIVAGGVLSAPDYTRSCTCSYQNQASLALVPMPEGEIWTRFPLGPVKAVVYPPDKEKTPATTVSTDRNAKPIKHLGMMLGAPGHRRADDGCLWLNDYEHLQVKYDNFGFYTGHSSKITAAGGSWPWVVASGCRGVSQLVLAIKTEGPAKDGVRYAVRLHFADPDNDQAGRRVFDVAIQDEVVLKELDVAQEAGGRNRGLVKEFKGVKVKNKMEVRFIPREGVAATPASVPLLCGIEVVREDE